MDRLIVDTSVLVAVERDRTSLDEHVGDDADVAIAAISVAELLVGAELADSRRSRSRRAFVAALRELVDVVDYSWPVAGEHARLLAHVRRSGRPRGAHDLVVTATAVAGDRLLLTADGAAAFGGLPRVAERVVALG